MRPARPDPDLLPLHPVFSDAVRPRPTCFFQAATGRVGLGRASAQNQASETLDAHRDVALMPRGADVYSSRRNSSRREKRSSRETPGQNRLSTPRTTVLVATGEESGVPATSGLGARKSTLRGFKTPGPLEDESFLGRN